MFWPLHGQGSHSFGEMIAQMMAKYRPNNLACNSVNKSRKGYNPLLNRDGILLIIISLWMGNMNSFEVIYSK